MVNVLIPWKLELYEFINGYHPLVAGFVEAAPPGVNFVFPGPVADLRDRDCQEVAFEFLLAGLRLGREAVPADFDIGTYLSHFIGTRDARAQIQMLAHSDAVDVVFHHTTPVHMNALPFILHFESLTTLFWPALLTGQTRDVALRGHPIFRAVKRRLESGACRAIFTHLKSSHRALLQCFDSPVIAGKAHHIPLGVTVPAAIAGRVERKIAAAPRDNGINILFTNSLNRNPSNFFLRGGVELLIAFQELQKSFPESTLTLLSPRPAVDLFQNLNLPNVTWIEDAVGDDALHDLLLAADVFALPAAGLHSYSALRAMRCGAVLICSDAPGYDEFVVDGETGIVVRGRLAEVYQPDPETGWMREDYSKAYEFQPQIANELAAVLLRLAQNPAERQRIAAAACDHVVRRCAMEPWVDGIAALLRGPSVPPPPSPQHQTTA